MRLLCAIPFYKPAFSFGGPVRNASNLCEAFARLGVEMDVYTTNAAGVPRRRLPPLDVALHQPVEVLKSICESLEIAFM